ncbi:Oidioi.mRNA.OKI2018_I69.chr1.g3252.t1.cds [Oikopleura dioica]|uniref:Oidioi.mRNA.OKI2018_I69.chr1.g3252.t1.cds n=1 Tax=Oikopleura dioica TaxID=34765 RepID=A0ABN7SX35_OIKDI|nr:Oidioi.mRNA.OKI2018_I69.chr1.g3252.t1.cds [Oikopleura dioica]
MPVTSALAARLAKRGIKINKEGPKEEIFAESRSEPKEETVIDEFGEKLPSEWDKAWDSNYECWYYWNKNSRKVAWLPPGDPECEIVEPAKSFNAIPHKYESSSRDRDTRRRDDRDDRNRDRDRDRDDRKRRPDRDRTDRGRSHRDDDRKKKRREEEDDFNDPMDPSAYSDAPKGNWNRGIPRPGESVSTAGVPQVEL